MIYASAGGGGVSKLEATSRLPSHVLEQEMYGATTHDGASLKPRALEAMAIHANSVFISFFLSAFCTRSPRTVTQELLKPWQEHESVSLTRSPVSLFNKHLCVCVCVCVSVCLSVCLSLSLQC